MPESLRILAGRLAALYLDGVEDARLAIEAALAGDPAPLRRFGIVTSPTTTVGEIAAQVDRLEECRA